jgi:DNA modification methylase
MTGTDAPWRIINADVREGLKQLEADSVQCIVTSFPYWSLRDYSLTPQIWDAKDPDCKHVWVSADINSGERCAKNDCGAWRGDWGLEPTPEDFYRHCVQVCRELRRVLRPDGCMFLNIGDSWWGDRSFEGEVEGTDGTFERQRKRLGTDLGKFKFPKKHAYLKPKDLVLQGPNLMVELQKDGWWLRLDNVWSKPNPQRGAVFDRAIKAHEYVFLLAKSEKFFYDPDAVRTKTGAHLLSVWSFPSANFYSPIGEHYATFPEELPRLCILGGTSERGACVKCGAPWKRITELGDHDREHQKACGGSSVDGTYKGKARKKGYEKAGAQDPSVMKANILARMRERKTVGWEPTCACGVQETRPCVVLDPCCGSGTTPAVARLLGRSGIGIDVSPESAAIAEDRVRTVFSRTKRPKREDPAQKDLFGMPVTAPSVEKSKCERCGGAGEVDSTCSYPHCGRSGGDDHACNLGGKDPCPECQKESANT